MVNKKVQWRFLACILFSQYRKTFKLNLVLVMFLELFVFFSSLTSFINCFYNHNLQNPFKTSTGKRKYSSVLQFFKWFFRLPSCPAACVFQVTQVTKERQRENWLQTWMPLWKPRHKFPTKCLLHPRIRQNKGETRRSSMMILKKVDFVRVFSRNKALLRQIIAEVFKKERRIVSLARSRQAAVTQKEPGQAADSFFWHNCQWEII